ncbi:PREDICTED: uncharacterized protein LOC105449916 isoform X2 [Wasmannia auropunctata]|uniref:uncharacterized protein LOC105449916 isoform X2 n=1 Tax=Wasmannia auropunctata TaxID=64793 RepID=UPI0005F0615F|nr:PREDICTED: uncharacterized protein LOC105449916 isoform X2 [Wasmannia auropunctata]
MIRDSVAQTITLTSFAFFLTSWLNSASGTSANDLQFVPNTSDIEPWFQPCGTRLAASRRMHNSSDSNNIMKRVRTQLRVAQNHFNKTFKDVRIVYSKVYRVLLKEQYKMNWLPKKQLEWYHTELWCLERGKKAERALPRLYDALQKFSITFHFLREYRLDSNIDVTRGIIKRRTRIIDKAHNQVLRLLCEVEAAMINLELRTSTLNDAFIITDNVQWAKEGDLTLMLIQDWGVLKLYHTFLKDWIKVFRNATSANDNSCDRNIKSIALTQKQAKKLFQKGEHRTRTPRKHKSTRKPGGRNNSVRQNLRKGSERNRLMKKKKSTLRPTLRT